MQVAISGAVSALPITCPLRSASLLISPLISHPFDNETCSFEQVLLLIDGCQESGGAIHLYQASTEHLINDYQTLINASRCGVHFHSWKYSLQDKHLFPVRTSVCLAGHILQSFCKETHSSTHTAAQWSLRHKTGSDKRV